MPLNHHVTSLPLWIKLDPWNGAQPLCVWSVHCDSDADKGLETTTCSNPFFGPMPAFFTFFFSYLLLSRIVLNSTFALFNVLAPLKQFFNFCFLWIRMNVCFHSLKHWECNLVQDHLASEAWPSVCCLWLWRCHLTWANFLISFMNQVNCTSGHSVSFATRELRFYQNSCCHKPEGTCSTRNLICWTLDRAYQWFFYVMSVVYKETKESKAFYLKGE